LKLDLTGLPLWWPRLVFWQFEEGVWPEKIRGEQLIPHFL
jgi:hypothetical protein